MEAVQQRTSLEVQKSHKNGPMIHFFVIWYEINIIIISIIVIVVIIIIIITIIILRDSAILLESREG